MERNLWNRTYGTELGRLSTPRRAATLVSTVSTKITVVSKINANWRRDADGFICIFVNDDHSVCNHHQILRAGTALIGDRMSENA